MPCIEPNPQAGIDWNLQVTFNRPVICRPPSPSKLRPSSSLLGCSMKAQAHIIYSN